MSKKIHFFIFLSVLLVFVLGFYNKQDIPATMAANACNGGCDDLIGWGWSGGTIDGNPPMTSDGYIEGIGWISFSSNNCNTSSGLLIPACGGDGVKTGAVYGVSMDKAAGAKKYLHGYAWVGNAGLPAPSPQGYYIQFGPTDTSSSRSLAGQVKDITGNTQEWAYVDSSNKLKGWARACSALDNSDCTGGVTKSGGWDGWISLSGVSLPSNTPYGASYSPTKGNFTGFAWGGGDNSEVPGWLKLSYSGASISNNKCLADPNLPECMTGGIVCIDPGVCSSSGSGAAPLQASCWASSAQVDKNINISWNSIVSGGPSGGYRYVWTETGESKATPVPGTSQQLTLKYTNPGIANMSLLVTSLADSTFTKTIPCYNAISGGNTNGVSVRDPAAFNYLYIDSSAGSTNLNTQIDFNTDPDIATQSGTNDPLKLPFVTLGSGSSACNGKTAKLKLVGIYSDSARTVPAIPVGPLADVGNPSYNPIVTAGLKLSITLQLKTKNDWTNNKTYYLKYSIIGNDPVCPMDSAFVNGTLLIKKAGAGTFQEI